MDERIRFSGVSKQFHQPDPNRAWTLQDFVLQRLRSLSGRGFRRRSFRALDDISFRLAGGRMMGVIGRNGAGKSTLLRLAGGVGEPDSGTVCTQGRIGALIDLGAGFHPDLTGRENVLINGVISGLAINQVKRRFDEIVQFAELKAFIDSPLRTYSTGMQMRLAFSVATHTDPEILLIDEVLAVGDMAFQQKCLDRIAGFKERGCAILLVSHDIGMIRRLCDEALWLEKGKIVEHGPAHMVADHYSDSMQHEQRKTSAKMGSLILPSGLELRPNENRFGTFEVQIEAVRLTDGDGETVSAVCSGDGLRVELNYSAAEAVKAPIFGVSLSQEDGTVIYDTSTAGNMDAFRILSGRGKVILHLERLDLAGGEYFVDVGIYQQDWEYAYDYHWHVYPLEINATSNEKGVLRPPHRWEFYSEP